MNSYSAIRTNRIDFLFILVATLVLLVGIATHTLNDYSYDIQITLTIFSFTLLLWITKPIPYSISSLLCIILLYTSGVADSFGQAAAGFSSNLVIFMILLLLIGGSINEVGLDEWVANRLISSTSTPNRSIRRIVSATLALTFIIPSGMARTVTFMPIVDQVNQSYNLDDDSQFRRLAYYVIGHLNLIGSLALMTGGGMAITTAEMINSLVQPITWVEWAIYMAPPSVLLFTLSAVVAGLLYNVNVHSKVATETDESAESVDTSEPLDRQQKLVIATLVVAIASWIIGSFVGVPTIVPAVFVVTVFALPGVRIITTETVRSISWEVIFLLGAMLSLLEIMQNIDAFGPLTRILGVGLPWEAHPVIILTIIFLSAILVRAVFSSVAGSFIVLFPVVLELTAIIDVNALHVAFSLAIILMTVNFLPFNNPVVLIAHERGPLKVIESFFLAVLTLGMSVLVLTLCWLFYWPYLSNVL